MLNYTEKGGMEGTVMPDKPVFTHTDREVFRGLIEAVAARPEIGIISNRLPWQAKMVLEKLLEIAKAGQKEIRLLSGFCPQGFYDNNFAGRLADCKDAGCPSIRVLIWQKDQETIPPAFRKILDEGKIELRVSGTDAHATEVPHFLLVGESAFRQEAGHAPFTKDTVITDFEPPVPARADFNDPVTGKSLKEIFDKFWGPA
jgi:hypothetical protein